MPETKDTSTLKEQLAKALQDDSVDSARDLYHHWVGHLPRNDGLEATFGELCIRVQEYGDAILYLKPACEEQPGRADLQWLLGTAYLQSNQNAEARACFERAVGLDPNHVVYRNDLAATYILERNYEAAVPILQEAYYIDNHNPNILTNLANCLCELAEYERAIALAERCLLLTPHNPFLHYVAGRSYHELGKPAQAIEYYQQAIQDDPTFGMAYLGIASSRKFTDADAELLATAEATLKQSMSHQDRVLIHFTLGKAYDDLKQWDKAFGHYRQGNIIRKAEISYSLHPPVELFKLMQQLFTAEVLQLAPQLGSDTQVPYFILGMPRSGSTLVEQILSSHPEVMGAGELNIIQNMFADCFTNVNQAQLQLQHLLSDSQMLNKLAEAYLAKLPPLRKSCFHVIDKQPFNFLYIGFIYLLFPRARIIHTMRDPVDTALSCYFQNFKTIEWACDLEAIANHYLFYQSVMAYWEKVLPAGTIIHLQYETLVQDPESQIRELLARCDLPWDPSCLAFYATDKHVKTASINQVRQPIYQSSHKRWKHYEKHIGTLIRLLAQPQDTTPNSQRDQHQVPLNLWQRLKNRLAP